MRNYQKRIVRDPQICGGEPVIRRTRVPVRTILASLAEGDRTDDILKDFPTLTEEDVRAVISFAAASAEEDLPPVPLPRFVRIKLEENLPAALVERDTTSIPFRVRAWLDSRIRWYGAPRKTLPVFSSHRT